MSLSKSKLIIYSALIALGAWSCQKLLPGAPEEQDVLARPIENLSGEQLALHLVGDELFAKVFSKEDGLGPIFVQASCENCHVGDGKGNPFNNLTRFGRYDTALVWDPMLSEGGPQLQHRAITNYVPELIPSSAASSEFIAPNVTGMGFLEAVPDVNLLAIVAEQISNGDVSGEVAYVDAPSYLIPDPRYNKLQPNGKYIGRFGRKASAIDLIHQTTNAYKQDMGITSDNDPDDPINFSMSVLGDDGVADPEIPQEEFAAVVFYVRTLGAPLRRNETDADVVAGKLLFKQIGCNSCHREQMQTGKSEIEALNNVTFYPYSDLLLHDMGSALDDSYKENSGETYEWRTTPLWGLGLQDQSQGSKMFLMHDGRATSIEGAIELHGAESAASRTAYNALTATQKDQLIAFLMSL